MSKLLTFLSSLKTKEGKDSMGWRGFVIKNNSKMYKPGQLITIHGKVCRVTKGRWWQCPFIELDSCGDDYRHECDARSIELCTKIPWDCYPKPLQHDDKSSKSAAKKEGQ